MAIKRKILEEKMATMEEDRLSTLPDDLKNSILSCLDLNEAVQTSVLSKSWVSTWTRIPVLKLNVSGFTTMEAFDEVVNKVFSLRDESAPLKRLSFEHWGVCSPDILKKVFDFACTHSVAELKVNVDISEDLSWPVCVDVSSVSVTSLVLNTTMISIGCPFLRPSSGSFKNLTNLQIDGPVITDLETFSGFPALESLVLLHLEIKTEGKILRVKAPNLATLIISTACYNPLNCCELTTPKLKMFGHEGSEFPRIRTHEALSVFDSLTINLRSKDYDVPEKRRLDDLFSMFRAFENARLVALDSPVIALISMYEDELVKRPSPFKNLKHLMLIFKGLEDWASTECSRMASNLKAYFLDNSPDVKFTMINPNH